MNIRITNDSVEIDGYVNAVERLSRPLSDRLGKFVERVKVGAFRRAIERNDDIRLLLNHDYTRELGSTKNGSLELHEDAIGLHARAIIHDEDVIRQARNGELRGWSFGFKDRPDGVEIGNENGMTVRSVKDMDLYEVSLINMEKRPAYDGTLVSVRTDDKVLNISDIFESEVKLTEEAKEVEERAEESADVKVINYDEYKEMIKEMKGE